MADGTFQPILKPKDREPKELVAVHIHADGREVCQSNTRGREEYRRRRMAMFVRDKGICCICQMPITRKSDITFEHKNGRGSGGAKRDDRIEFNGVAHLACNIRKGSQRI